ncbi:MAG TPA: UDP-N-acetylmuramoyl-L-alanine--D-glutamate ligase [Desulfomicrobiaceae bacterium]|nr:UDP-N-acetylmuramoyl-L-alanine--D-glutamate ligase [Desulfomicrobiaceae bacterium]
MLELIYEGQLAGHKAVVVGAARSGVAAAKLLSRLGASVTLADSNEAALGEPEVQEPAGAYGWKLAGGAHTEELFVGADLVILSPGVPRRVVDPFLPQKVQVVSELEFASWFVSEPIVALTGTNGKTTTTALLGHVLEKTKRKVFLGGNFGVPLSEYVLAGERVDILVLEVSSFQLQNISSFRPRVAVMLNFAANHLDYHQSMDEYFEAKMSLFSRQCQGDLAILPLELKDRVVGKLDPAVNSTWFVATRRFHCPQLPGAHNRENLEAAFLVARHFGVTEAEMQSALKDFTPMEHRLESIVEKHGVVFVNDSKATTVGALAAALRSMDRPTLLLAGGVFKGGDLEELVPLLREKVLEVFLFGAGREIFEQAWKGGVPLHWTERLEDAVQQAFERSRPGDAILLSPATASFDQFRNYKERGRVFSAAARALDVRNIGGETQP